MGSVCNEPYDEKHIKWLRKYRPSLSLKETQIKFNKRFGTDYSVSQIKHRCIKNNIRGINDGKFRKGHDSWNKGMKIKETMPEYYQKIITGTIAKNTGRSPISIQPVGSERLWGGEYYQIKVAMPDVWRQRSRVVYERTHNCILTDKDRILHLDGNKLNDDPDNLYLVDDSILARLNKEKLICEEGKITKVAVAHQMLLREIRKQKKK